MLRHSALIDSFTSRNHGFGPQVGCFVHFLSEIVACTFIVCVGFLQVRRFPSKELDGSRLASTGKGPIVDDQHYTCVTANYINYKMFILLLDFSAS